MSHKQFNHLIKMGERERDKDTQYNERKWEGYIYFAIQGSNSFLSVNGTSKHSLATLVHFLPFLGLRDMARIVDLFF